MTTRVRSSISTISKDFRIGQWFVCLFKLLFNNMSTLVGHYVLFFFAHLPEKERRETNELDERKARNRWGWRKKRMTRHGAETEEILTCLHPTCCKYSRLLPPSTIRNEMMKILIRLFWKTWHKDPFPVLLHIQLYDGNNSTVSMVLLDSVVVGNLYSLVIFCLFKETSYSFQVNLNGYTFKGDKFFKIVLAPFWNGVYSKKSNLFPSLRKHAYSNILKILPSKTESFQIKILIVFHISAQNIDCGYSLELPYWGSFKEYPQSMFLSRNKKNNIYPVKTSFTIQKLGLRGSKLYRYVCFRYVRVEIFSKTILTVNYFDSNRPWKFIHSVQILLLFCR